MADSQTLLLRVAGPDQSGIVALLMSHIADAGADVHDVEQIVIRGNISLSIVVDVPPGNDLLKNVLLFGWEHDLDVDFEIVDSTPTTRPFGWVVTVLGQQLSSADLQTVTATIAECGHNIDRIERLSRYPVYSYELKVSGGDGEDLQNRLLSIAAKTPTFDIAIQREGLGRRAQRLVVLDVDSTLIQNEVIDLIADVIGCGDEVASITEAAMQGELDFEEALRSRVALFAGQPVEVLERAWERLELTPGARTFVRTLKRLGFRIAIVSGGFTFFTDRLCEELGLDYAFANRLAVRRGVLTGEVDGPIVDRRRKATLLDHMAKTEGISPDQVVAVGDGANDIDMLEAAGLGIAFNAKPAAAEVADTAVSVPYLDAILFVLGVRRELVESEGLTPANPPAVT